MKMKNIIIIIALIAFASCKKNAEPAPKEYPDVLLDKITEISPTGAIFTAQVDYLSKYDILDYGFVWSESNSKPTLSDFKVSLGKDLKIGSFSANITHDLAEGKIYNVRAYIQNRRFIVYSKEQSFSSLGVLPPEISSFSPVKAFDGTIITMKGKNFSQSLSGNIVKIGNTVSEVIAANENEIQIKSPTVNFTGDFKITVEVLGQTATSEGYYTIIGPIITSVSPIQVIPGDHITIIGHNLIVTGQQTFISISEIPAFNFSADTNKIVAIVPYWLTSGALKINIGSKEVKFDTNITVLTLWLKAKNLEYTVDPIDLFSINTKGYALVNKSLYEYNPDLDSWSNKSNFPGNINSGSFKFVIGNKLYMGGGIGSDTSGQINSNEFWVFDQDTNSWTRMNDIDNLSGNVISPWAFSTDGLGYINYNGYLWCFNPQTNQWVRKTNIPGDTSLSGTVIMNTVPFIIEGKRLWKYNNQVDQFYLTTTCPLNKVPIGGIGLNFDGYFMDRSGNAVRYLSFFDIWQTVDNYPCNGGTAVPAFVLANKVFFGNFGGGGSAECQFTMHYVIPD